MSRNRAARTYLRKGLSVPGEVSKGWAAHWQEALNTAYPQCISHQSAVVIPAQDVQPPALVSLCLNHIHKRPVIDQKRDRVLGRAWDELLQQPLVIQLRCHLNESRQHQPIRASSGVKARSSRYLALTQCGGHAQA
eukprot:scaffold174518_cov31-Tisochrysis_lutea.AAC.4